MELIEQATGPTNLSWYYWVVDDEDEWPEGEWVKWSPIHDANQMEMVEEEVLKLPDGKGNLDIYMQYEAGLKMWFITIINYTKDSENEFKGRHADKKRAFALAVYAMSQERDSHVPSH